MWMYFVLNALTYIALNALEIFSLVSTVSTYIVFDGWLKGPRCQLSKTFVD